MQADPEFCNGEARRCIQVAAASADPEVKRAFTDLAESWRRLAAQLYYANTIRDLREKDKPDV
jgi:hypothetical protein